MQSKQITHRQKDAQAVLAVGKAHREEIVTGLIALLTPVLAGKEKLPDLDFLVELHVRVLQKVLDALLGKEDAYQHELLDDEPPRQARDDAAAALYDRLIELREVLIGVYGAATAREVGLSGTTPQDSAQLSRFASQVSRALGAIQLPKPRITGASLRAAGVAEELDQLRQTLDQHRDDVARESREAQAALSARQTAQATFDETYAGVAGLFASLLRLAGKRDLADRVRPTVRRGSSSASSDDEPAPGTPPTDANST